MSFPDGPHNRRRLTADPPSDQRRSRRFRATLPVDLTQGTSTRRVESVDVSRHGIFVAVENPPPLRFLVRVSIGLPDGPLVANAFVSRRQTDHEPYGAGLQFFAMASQAKARWDYFVGRIGGLHSRVPRALRRPSDLTPPPPLMPAPEASSFMVKLPNIERLEAFFDRAVWTRSVYMVTPLIRPVGTPVSVVLIHPITSDEFTLGGIISRVRTDSPKGIEIQLDAISEETKGTFAVYLLQRERRSLIPSGHTPPPQVWTKPPPAHAPPPIISAGEPADEPRVITPSPIPMEPPVEHPLSSVPPADVSSGFMARSSRTAAPGSPPGLGASDARGAAVGPEFPPGFVGRPSPRASSLPPDARSSSPPPETSPGFIARSSSTPREAPLGADLPTPPGGYLARHSSQPPPNRFSAPYSESRRSTTPPARPTPAPMPPGSVPPARSISQTADTADLEEREEPSRSISIDLSAFPPIDESMIEDEHRFEWGSISDDLIIDLDLSEFEKTPAPLEEVDEISGEEMMEAARSSAPPPLKVVEEEPTSSPPPPLREPPPPPERGASAPGAQPVDLGDVPVSITARSVGDAGAGAAARERASDAPSQPASAASDAREQPSAPGSHVATADEPSAVPAESAPITPQPSFEDRISQIVPAPRDARVTCSSCARNDVLAVGPAPGPIGLFAEHRVFWCRKCRHAVAIPRLTNPRARIDLKDKLPEGTVGAAQAIELAAQVAELAMPPRCPTCNEVARTNRETKALDDALKKGGSGEVKVDRVPCSKCGTPALALVLP